MSTRPKVLVVDDDPDIGDMVSLVLEQHGYEVRSANNGLEALERIRGGWHPDVILLDMRMPVMTGPEFVSTYRVGPPPHARIVAVTAARDARESAASVAADDCIAKPFDLDELVEVIGRQARRTP